MENLEIKGVRTPEDIKNVYLKAVEQNAKYYRAVSNSGKYYGWETSLAYPQGHHVPAQVGQDWFVNNKYVEPVEEPIEEPIEPVEEPVEEIAQEKVEEPIAEVAETTTAQEPVIPSVDYKTLYEDALKQIDTLGEELSEQDKYINALKQEIEKISTEYADYKAGIEIVKKFFRE